MIFVLFSVRVETLNWQIEYTQYNIHLRISKKKNKKKKTQEMKKIANKDRNCREFHSSWMGFPFRMIMCYRSAIPIYTAISILHSLHMNVKIQ